MRKLAIVGVILCLTGCATVTVQPASMTASFTAVDSELTKSARAYCKEAETLGWVTTVSPMAFLQSKLFGTGNAETDAALKVYADRIEADDLAPPELEARLVSDVERATRLLAELNTQAAHTLSSDEEPVRADIISFEDALVTAGKSRQAFDDANQILGAKAERRAARVEREFSGFDSEIRKSRNLADALTSAWQKDDTQVS